MPSISARRPNRARPYTKDYAERVFDKRVARDRRQLRLGNLFLRAIRGTRVQPALAPPACVNPPPAASGNSTQPQAEVQRRPDSPFPLYTPHGLPVFPARPWVDPIYPLPSPFNPTFSWVTAQGAMNGSLVEQPVGPLETVQAEPPQIAPTWEEGIRFHFESRERISNTTAMSVDNDCNLSGATPPLSIELGESSDWLSYVSAEDMIAVEDMDEADTLVGFPGPLTNAQYVAMVEAGLHETAIPDGGVQKAVDTPQEPPAPPLPTCCQASINQADGVPFHEGPRVNLTVDTQELQDLARNLTRQLESLNRVLGAIQDAHFVMRR